MWVHGSSIYRQFSVSIAMDWDWTHLMVKKRFLEDVQRETPLDLSSEFFNCRRSFFTVFKSYHIIVDELAHRNTWWYSKLIAERKLGGVGGKLWKIIDLSTLLVTHHFGFVWGFYSTILWGQVIGGGRVLGKVIRQTPLVNTAITAHAVESLAESFHHGVCQLFGIQLTLTLHSVAVHLEWQIVIDLPVDPGKYVGPNPVVCCAIGDPGHLVGAHGYWSIAVHVQVVKAHLEWSDLQQRVACGAGVLTLCQGATFHQTYNCWFCAARQELGSRDSNLTKVSNLQRIKYILGLEQMCNSNSYENNK